MISQHRVHSKSSRHQRCPVCKKLRMWWMRANQWSSNSQRWGHLKDGRKACWVCMKREAELGSAEYSRELESIAKLMNS